jgi:hypothetical protein
MSWKNYLSVGLLCLLASPALAVGPTLGIRNTGLDANGNWTWEVRIAPSGTDTPLATEIGLQETTAGAQVIAVANGADKYTAAATAFDTNTAGNGPAGWTIPTFGSPAKPEGVWANCTGCTVTNAAGLPAGTAGLRQGITAGVLDQIFEALGSKPILAADLSSPAAIPPGANATPAGLASSVQILTITTLGPVIGRLDTTLQVSGAYGAGSNAARIAESTTPTTSTNYNYAGSNTRTTIEGDANMSGKTDVDDLIILAGNFNKPGSFSWAGADFNGETAAGAGGDNEVDIDDLIALAGKFNQSSAVYTPLSLAGTAGGAGVGAGSLVPEPASVALIGLALLGGLGVIRRKR